MKLLLLSLVTACSAVALDLAPGEQGNVNVAVGDLRLTAPGTYSGSNLNIGVGDLVLVAEGVYRLDFSNVSLAVGSVRGPGGSTEIQVRGNFSISVGGLEGATLGSFSSEPEPNTPVLPDEIGSAPLSNLSVLLNISGGQTVAVGFVVTGNSPRTLLVRAVGPGTENYGVQDFMNDPQFTISRSGGNKVAENNDWESGVAEFAALAGAFPLTSGSKDAALVASFEPGVYSAVISDATGQGGSVILEVYFIE